MPDHTLTIGYDNSSCKSITMPLNAKWQRKMKKKIKKELRRKK